MSKKAAKFHADVAQRQRERILVNARIQFTLDTDFDSLLSTWEEFPREIYPFLNTASEFIQARHLDRIVRHFQNDEFVSAQITWFLSEVVEGDEAYFGILYQIAENFPHLEPEVDKARKNLVYNVL